MRRLSGSALGAMGLHLFIGVAGPARAAQLWAPDDAYSCSKAETTIDIVSCADRRTSLWDARLNQAYKALQAMLGEGAGDRAQRDQLTKAQRLWVQYRDADCGYYGLNQGTIREVEVAECRRRMTQDRAIELQAAGPQ